jgi:hypothetical protein
MDGWDRGKKTERNSRGYGMKARKETRESQ